MDEEQAPAAPGSKRKAATLKDRPLRFSARIRGACPMLPFVMLLALSGPLVVVLPLAVLPDIGNIDRLVSRRTEQPSIPK